MQDSSIVTELLRSQGAFTDTSVEDEQRRLVSALYRQRLSAFTEKVFSIVSPGDKYLHNWHIELIGEYLEACSRREIKRLIINMPPRSMKSICVSVAWPAWLLGKNPAEGIVAFSYAQKLSFKHSMDTRLVMESPWYKALFPETRIAADQNAKEKFVTTRQGHRIASSFGASALGEGGNFLIVDDPLNPEEALSKVERNGANVWYDQNIPTRLNNKKEGVIAVCMQRLDAMDVTGHLLAKEAGYEHCLIPAICNTRTIIDFGRVHRVLEAGDILHAEREGLKELEATKRELGSYAFAGQYMQSPAPIEGGMVKYEWFGRYDQREQVYKRIIQSWDTAIKGADHNDPSVCLTFGETDNGCDLLDVLVARLEYPDLKRKVYRMAETFCPHAILVEDKGSGQQIIQDFRQESKLPVIGIMPHKDKITRLSAVSAMIEAGRVRLPKYASWLSDFETEILQFPAAAHDDQVDGISQYLDWSRGGGGLFAPRIRRL